MLKVTALKNVAQKEIKTVAAHELSTINGGQTVPRLNQCAT